MKITLKNLVWTTASVFLILLTSFLLLAEALTKPSGVKLVNNQYTGIVVAIHEEERENSELIDSIKRMFVRGSSYLYTATKKRAYFKEVTILIPSSWSDNPSYWTVRNESFNDADIVIAPPNPRFSPNVDLPPPPYTKHCGGCGKQGIHIHFTSRFLLDRSLENSYGDFGRMLVHEWAHYRWGLFNEYPDSIEDGRYSNYYYLSSITGFYEPVACPRSWNMSPMKYTGIPSRTLKRCNGNQRIGYESGCMSVAEEVQPHFTASIMMNKHLRFEQIIHFCDNDTKDEETLHNSEADNKFNRLCGGRSSWEVMKEHDDFRGNSNLPRDIGDVRPTFTIVRENEVGKPVVLLLDTSGSMSAMNRSKRLQSVARSFISTVERGCRVGIVDFDSQVKILSPLRRIGAERSREELTGLIKVDHSGGTCIGCGVRKALKVIPEGKRGKIILITDGKDSKTADLLAAQAKCVRRGIVVDSIAYSDMAQENLRLLSESTGGKFYLQTDDPRSRGALRAFSENANCGRQRTSLRRILVFSSVYTLASGYSQARGIVEIDPTIGLETKFVFSYFVKRNTIQVKLTPPSGGTLDNGYTGYRNDVVSKIITVNIVGIAEIVKMLMRNSGADVQIVQAGTWRFTIINRSFGSYEVTVSVSSLPATERVPPIEIKSYLSGTEAEVTAKTPLVVIAEVRQGLYPIVNARVIATVERPTSVSGRNLGPVEMTLRDDGTGFDVTKNDGIYVRAFTNFTGVGFYGVSVRAENGGEAMVLLPDTWSRDAEFKVNEAAFWDETSITFNDSYLGTLDLTAPNFNRECSAGASYVSRIPNGWTPESDIFPPSKILDLAVTFIDVKRTMINITCSAPGGDLDSGKASSYVILRSNSPHQLHNDALSVARSIDDGDVLSGNLRSPSEFGHKEEFSIHVPLPEGQSVTPLFFAIFAVDESGNRGEISNVIQVLFQNDTFRDGEEVQTINAANITETPTEMVTPTEMTQGIRNATTVNTYVTMDKETTNSIMVKTTPETTAPAKQNNEIMHTEVNVKVETTEEELDGAGINAVTKAQKANINAVKTTDTESITDVIMNTITSTTTEVTPYSDTASNNGATTNIGGKIRPDKEWKTDRMRNLGTTVKTNGTWDTGLHTNIEVTINQYAEKRTPSNLHIDGTVSSDRTWKTDPNIDATEGSEEGWETDALTDVNSTVGPEEEWEMDAKTVVEPEKAWKTATKTIINATAGPKRELETKTNISPTDWSEEELEITKKTTVGPVEESETDANTNIKEIGTRTIIYLTVGPGKELETDAKTNIRSTFRSEEEWEDTGTNIHATVRLGEGLETGANTTLEPDEKWKTTTKTIINATAHTSITPTVWSEKEREITLKTAVEPQEELETDTNTSVSPTVWSEEKREITAKTTVEPGEELKPVASTIIYSRVGPGKELETDTKASINPTVRPEKEWEMNTKTSIHATVRPEEEWESDAKTVVQSEWKWKTATMTNVIATDGSERELETGKNTIFNPTVGPKEKLETDAKTNIDVTIRPEMEWETDDNITIEPEEERRTDTEIIYTAVGPGKELKADAKTTINGTARPKEELDTDTKTNINTTVRPEEEWETIALTTLEPAGKWKDDTKTIYATVESEKELETDTKTNINAAVIPGIEWEITAKTHIQATISHEAELKTDAKTKINSTVEPERELETGKKTNINATVGPKTELNKTSINITATPRKELETVAKTSTHATVRPEKEWETNARTNINTIVRPEENLQTNAMKNISATGWPKEEWETGASTTVEAEKKWKTDTKTITYVTVKPEEELETNDKTNIIATVRLKGEWKTSTKIDIDANVRPDEEWEKDAMTKVITTGKPEEELEIGSNPDLEGSISSYEEWMTDSNIYFDTRIIPETPSRTDAISKADTVMEISTTITALVLTDDDKKETLHLMTTSFGITDGTLPIKGNETDSNNTMKTGCEEKFGWKQFNGSCYKLLYLPGRKGHNFTTMLGACKKEGANNFGKYITRVADITSEAENEFVAKNVSMGKRAWIGAARDGKGDTFIWKIGDGNHVDPKMNGFTNWKPHEPNNKWNMESCVEINRGPAAGGWNDIRCKRKRPIICKYSLSSLGKR